MKKRWIGAVAVYRTDHGSAMTAGAEETNIQEESKALEAAQPDWLGRRFPGTGGMSMPQVNIRPTAGKRLTDTGTHFDRDGFIASDWTRIGGVDYCFSETGELELGWCYNDEEEAWHYFNEDGTARTGWYQDDSGSWYWFSTKVEMADSGYKTVLGKLVLFL